jgi:catechol 2,3-dioxygenase-like lactoylglutathione lyase family enzyme
MRLARQFVGLCVVTVLLAGLAAALYARARPQSTKVDRPQITNIAVVRIRVTNRKASHAFYSKILGLPQAKQGCFSKTSANVECFNVNSSQKIELVTNDPGDGKNGIEAVAYHARDANLMREYLVVRGVQVGDVKKDAAGDNYIEVRDPEQHRVIFISPGTGVISNIAISPKSNQLIHTGWVIKDRGASDVFYRDVLGFHLYWQGGMKDNETSWVAMQEPNGNTWLEYMLNISPTADHHTLGVMNHISLGVVSIQEVEARLIKNGWKPTEKPKVGRDGKWQLNVYDPDDTRVEFMEFKPAEKPCCSEFTGTHPGPR